MTQKKDTYKFTNLIQTLPKVHAIIVAAGSSQRFGKADKLLSELAGKPVLWHTVKAFEENKKIEKIVVVSSEKNLKKFGEVLKSFSKISEFIVGGKTRQESSFNGLKALNAKDDDIVLIHNGASPLVGQADIETTIKFTKKHGAALIGREVHSTLKKVDKEGIVQKTIERTGIWQAETPQGMHYGIAIKAFDKAVKEKLEATDDAQVLEKYGQPVKIFSCSEKNVKITNKKDLELAKIVLEPKTCQVSTTVGLGQDSHRFAEEKKPLVLGNYEISKTGGLEGNSDADVVLHALCNAFSSAIGGFSLSNWSDEMCKQGVKNSKFYLEKIYKEVLEKDFVVNNLSIALEAGKPKLEKHLPKIQETLAKLLKIKKEQIGITVTSGEGLSEFGKGLGIQCFCYLSLRRASSCEQ